MTGDFILKEVESNMKEINSKSDVGKISAKMLVKPGEFSYNLSGLNKPIDLPSTGRLYGSL